jgi:AcrR family transcriptional regulator
LGEKRVSVPREDSELLEALWHDATPTNRGPRPSLSREALAGKAVDIADAEGLEVVSMERVAGELGVTKMALYRYVKSKAELVAVMIEAAVGEPPDTVTRQGWRERLELWARSLRAHWRRHPWVPGATTGARMMGPREVAWTEAALAALAGTSLTPSQRHQLILTVSGYVRTTQAVTAAGTQPWWPAYEVGSRFHQLLQEQGDRYPALVEDSSAARATEDEMWDFGLMCILDGAAAAIARDR